MTKIDKRKAHDMRLAGASIKEIAEHFSCSTRAVNNTISHVRCPVNHRSRAISARHRIQGQTELMMIALNNKED
jgi:DNA-binding CsgD family transcriptional regulator